MILMGSMMKSSTPSFVVELRLKPSPQDKKALDKVILSRKWLTLLKGGLNLSIPKFPLREMVKF